MSAAPDLRSERLRGRPSTAVQAAIWLLFVAGVLRLALVAWHEPMAGYANQYDTIRSSACLGLWPDVPEAERTQAHPQAPIARHVRGAIDRAGCYPSTTVALAAVARLAHAGAHAIGMADAAFDLRWLGTLVLALLVATGALVQWRLMERAGPAVLHALAFALVVADPFDALWLNTLYTESGALLGAYASVAALALVAVHRRHARWAGALLVLGTLALAASRVQHLLLPLVFVATWAWLVQGQRAMRVALALAAVAWVAGLALALAIQSGRPTLAQANRIDTVFGALMPAADDPGAMAESLGLRRECGALVHVTWYLKRGHDVAAECPEALALPLSRIALGVVREPVATMRAFARGVLLANGWRPSYVGEVAGGNFARVEAPSVAGFVARLSFGQSLALWLVPIVAALVALVVLWRRRRDVAPPLAVLLFALGAVVDLTWASSLLGDGYSELARHLHLAANAALAAWLLLLGGILAAIARRDPKLIAARAGVLAAGLLVAVALQSWARTQPLAFGALRSPSDADVAGAVVALDGGVLDASPVLRVDAVLDDGRRLPMALAPDDALVAMFPPADPAQARRFTGTLDLSATPPGTPVRLRFVATNARGRESQFDLRVFSRIP
ncbi:MAG TPA: hypothetical protein VFL14_09850 [Xanthomonadales bacterium]|nr:hypothetical protein [Xanthomonadales bacterium]